MSGGYSLDAVGVVLLSERVAGSMSDAEAAVVVMQSARDEIDVALGGLSDVTTALGGVVTAREESASRLLGLARDCLEGLYEGTLAVVQGDEDMAAATRAAETSTASTGLYDSRRFGQRAV